MATTRLGLTATPTRPYGSFAGRAAATVLTGGDVQDAVAMMGTLLAQNCDIRFVVNDDVQIATLQAADVEA